MQTAYDYIVLGAGITGLCIAREIKRRSPAASILILEKEPRLGAHGSGRNSGVMHSGIYYPEHSLKAKVCSEGAREMVAYCRERKLPVNPMGKVVVPTKQDDDQQVDVLYQRAIANGANARIIDEAELKELEPFARTASGRALFSPDTSVIDPMAVLQSLAGELEEQGVKLLLASPCLSARPASSSVTTPSGRFTYGYLVNATGQFSDHVARHFSVGSDYTLLPFKGMYFKVAKEAGVHFNRLIYPVPDLNMPFLGIHSVTTIDGDMYFGPTAIPAFGREHYQGLKGIELGEAAVISYYLMLQYVKDNQGFRRFAHDEAGRFMKKRFAESAQKLVPAIKAEHLLPSNKVGIRAQLLDKRNHQLVTDFVVEHHDNTTHILNAISPAFTCG